MSALEANLLKPYDHPKWLRVLAFVAAVNFGIFLLVAIVSGGAASTGKKEAGRYFVGNHGSYTEVPRGFYVYSRVHHTISAILIGGVLVSGVWLAFTRGRR